MGTMRKRVAAFRRRSNLDPAELRRRRSLGEFICVHPMSDEHELLESIGVVPAACIKVDAYWFDGEDVHFVEVVSSAYGDETGVYEEPGIYARRVDGDA